MASGSMKELAKQRRAALEDEKSKRKKDDEIPAVDETPEDDLELEDDFEDREDDDTPPDEEDERFKRLAGKMSDLESSAHETARQLEEARKRIKELETPPAPDKTPEEIEKELEEQVRQEVGPENWDYFDDAQRKAFIAMAKRNSTPAEEVVQQRIDAELGRRDNERQASTFIEAMDKELAEHKTTIVRLINDKKFNAWLGEKRRRVAIFEDAVANKDEESVEDIKDLYAQYKNRDKSKVPKGSPDVRTNRKASKKPDAKKLTMADYERGIRMKRKYATREQGRKLIEAYKKQEGL